MKRNLVSIGAIVDTGHKVMFTSQECLIINCQNHLVASGERDPTEGLYFFRNQVKNKALALSTENFTLSTLWHRHLKHLNCARLNFLSRASNVIGLPKIRLERRACSCCVAGHQHRKRFPRKSENRSIKPGERIHYDLMEPMQHASLGGSRYVLDLTEDYFRKSWTYFLRYKSKTLAKFHNLKKR